MSGVQLSSSHIHTEPFTLLEREVIVAVLRDSVDQLSVLKAITPTVGKPSANVDALTDTLAEILENQHQLEEQFEILKYGQEQTKEEVHGLSMAAQATNNIRAMADNLEKLKRDRDFLMSIMKDTLHEVVETGTIESLQSSVSSYQNKKREMEETVKREQDCRKEIKKLKKQLLEVRKEKEDKIVKLDEEIAHFKDQLQELKARTGLVNKYIKKQSEVRVQCGQHKHQNQENDIEEEKVKLTQQLDEEKRAHAEIENYLKKHVEDLDGKVEYWMTRYEEDLEMKTLDVQEIESEKAAGLQKLDELTKSYKEREEVVVEHRAMKERQRRKEEQDRKENETATKLQAWWRGVMVRKHLGPYGKSAKKKGKKGKKGKGKGKKKGKKR